MFIKEKDMRKKKIKAVLACIIVLSVYGCAPVSDDPPSLVEPVVKDNLQLLPYGSVKLSGFVQERLQQQSEYLFDEQFLAEMVDAIRMQPHRLINGKPTGLAEGEFWGKAVRALSRYYQYSGDQHLLETLETAVADIM